MKDFWRYRTAWWLINAALLVWPSGREKTEIIEMLWQFRRRVEDREIVTREIIRRGKSRNG